MPDWLVIYWAVMYSLLALAAFVALKWGRPKDRDRTGPR